MEFDDEKLAPTYRLIWGIPGRSNALNIAQRLGLDPAVVAAARERLGSAEGVNHTIGNIEVLKRITEADEAAAAELEQEKARLTAEADRIRREMENAAVQQSRQALQTAIRIAKATRSQVRQAGQQAANAAEKAAADAAVKAAADAERAAFERQKAENWIPKRGEIVYVINHKTNAEVLNVRPEKQVVTVALPSLRGLPASVKLANIRRL
mmetsp:Transcript_17496/g.52526  ORF Transcript_17496/g.52526 Transcript_17496/m.52526 type:complete len:210 (+) Transcript_17496:2522-3151(+)